MRRLVVLRPEPGATATVEAARKIGLEALAAPLFTVKPLPWQAPDSACFDALLLTSANALLHGGKQLGNLSGLEAYCVGAATAQAAREAGFDIATTGDAGARHLLGSIEPDIRLLHLAGQHATALHGAEQSITTLHVYVSEELPAPSRISSVRDAVVLLHSKRAAARLALVLTDAGVDRSRVAVAAISPSVAEEAGAGWMELKSAERPDDPSLLALARSMCNKPGPL